MASVVTASRRAEVSVPLSAVAGPAAASAPSSRPERRRRQPGWCRSHVCWSPDVEPCSPRHVWLGRGDRTSRDPGGASGPGAGYRPGGGGPGAVADQGPRAGRGGTPPRRDWPGRSIVDRVDVTAAYVLPWKDHLAGELEDGRRRDDLPVPPRPRSALAAAPADGCSADGGFDVVHAHSPVPAAAARLARPDAARRAAAGRVIDRAQHAGRRTARSTRWANRAHRAGRRGDVRRHRRGAGLDVRAGRPSGPRCWCTASTSTASAARPAGERPRCAPSSGSADDEFVIGTVANLRAQKDYPNLLAAAARARRPGGGVPARRRRPGPAGGRDHAPARRARPARPRRAGRVPARRRRRDGGRATRSCWPRRGKGSRWR